MVAIAVGKWAGAELSGAGASRSRQPDAAVNGSVPGRRAALTPLNDENRPRAVGPKAVGQLGLGGERRGRLVRRAAARPRPASALALALFDARRARHRAAIGAGRRRSGTLRSALPARLRHEGCGPSLPLSSRSMRSSIAGRGLLAGMASKCGAGGHGVVPDTDRGQADRDVRVLAIVSMLAVPGLAAVWLAGIRAGLRL